MKTEYRIEDFDTNYARAMINKAVRNALEEEIINKKEEQLSCAIFAGVVIMLITAFVIIENFT